MTLPFTYMSSFVLSFLGVLFVAVCVYRALDLGIATIKKMNDA